IDPEDANQSWHSYTLEDVGGGVLKLVRQRTRGEHPIFSYPNKDGGSNVPIKTEDAGNEGGASRVVLVKPRSNPSCTLDTTPYTQIFGTFYNIPPSVSTTDIGAALMQSEELVKVAMDLGCLHLIQPYLGNVFGQFRQKLFVAIKSDPARWIQLAMALENTSIYTECLIHLVGAHPGWTSPTSKKTLPTELQQLIARKSEELDSKCTELERELLLVTIKVRRGPVTPQDGHVETWMLVQMFRDALATQLLSMRTPKQMTLRRGVVYRKLRKGGSEYMEIDEVRGVCRGIMQSDWKDLAEDLKILKEYAAAMVEDMAANELMIDPDAHGIGYLTCTKVKADDMPWHPVPFGS
ncbi:uncharacterized protein BDR25DRAFT_385577, partial [Lindgomyces ingoldianus]